MKRTQAHAVPIQRVGCEELYATVRLLIQGTVKHASPKGHASRFNWARSKHAQLNKHATDVTRTPTAGPLQTVRKAGSAYLHATVRLSTCQQNQKETRVESTHSEKTKPCSGQNQLSTYIPPDCLVWCSRTCVTKHNLSNIVTNVKMNGSIAVLFLRIRH